MVGDAHRVWGISEIFCPFAVLSPAMARSKQHISKVVKLFNVRIGTIHQKGENNSDQSDSGRFWILFSPENPCQNGSFNMNVAIACVDIDSEFKNSFL